MVRALWNGAVIADSDDTVIIDGNHYFRADDVNSEYLVPSDTTSFCGWKGVAGYHSLQVDGEVNRDAAWFYADPSPAASSIAGRIAFWHGVQIEDDGSAGTRRSFVDRFRRTPSTNSTTAPEPPGAVVESANGQSPSVIDVDDGSFFAAIDGQVTIADFWAPWCGPCTSFHPRFEEQAADHRSDLIQFVRVNVDESPGVAAAFNIMSIPTVISFDADGREIDREVGVPSNRRLAQLVRTSSAIATAGSGAA
jgi:thioredoxin